MILVRAIDSTQLSLSKSSPLLSLVFSKDIKVRASPVSETEVRSGLLAFKG